MRQSNKIVGLNFRKLKRNFIRQLHSFQNLSNVPEFQKDLKKLRAQCQKTDRPLFDYLKKNWSSHLKTKPRKELEIIYNSLKKDYGHLPNFQLNNKPKKAFAYLAYHHKFENEAKKLALKWNIRERDAWLIIVVNEYPPYFYAILRDIRETIPEHMLKHFIANRRKPEPSRFWWEKRVHDKPAQGQVWEMYRKGMRPADIYKSLPNLPVTPDAIKKIIKRKKIKQGQ